MEGKIRKFLTIFLCICMGFCAGIVVMYSLQEKLVGQPRSGDIAETIEDGVDKYEEIMRVIDSYYIGEIEDPGVINDYMADGVVAGIGDRWSYYIPAEEYETYQNGLNNEYVGIGITVQAQYDESELLTGYVVVEVTEDGPADKAGIQVNDLILAVNDESTADFETVTALKEKIQGPAGSDVSVTVDRYGKELTMVIRRDVVTIVPVVTELLDSGIGYVQIRNFDSGCSEAAISGIETLIESGAESILFDVRNNGGGLRQELVLLLDYLLPEGIIFQSEDYAGSEYVAESDAKFLDLPMAVLLNENSFSAAEYFACALQEYEAATVIGEKSTGKGYYQVGITLSDGSAVNLSIGKYYTPEGESLAGVGVTPDIEIKLDDEQKTLLASRKLSYLEDPQIQSAVNILAK